MSLIAAGFRLVSDRSRRSVWFLRKNTKRGLGLARVRRRTRRAGEPRFVDARGAGAGDERRDRRDAAGFAERKETFHRLRRLSRFSVVVVVVERIRRHRALRARLGLGLGLRLREVPSRRAPETAGELLAAQIKGHVPARRFLFYVRLLGVLLAVSFVARFSVAGFGRRARGILRERAPQRRIRASQVPAVDRVEQRRRRGASRRFGHREDRVAIRKRRSVAARSFFTSHLPDQPRDARRTEAVEQPVPGVVAPRARRQTLRGGQPRVFQTHLARTRALELDIRHVPRRRRALVVVLVVAFAADGVQEVLQRVRVRREGGRDGHARGLDGGRVGVCARVSEPRADGQKKSRVAARDDVFVRRAYAFGDGAPRARTALGHLLDRLFPRATVPREREQNRERVVHASRRRVLDEELERARREARVRRGFGEPSVHRRRRIRRAQQQRAAQTQPRGAVEERDVRLGRRERRVERARGDQRVAFLRLGRRGAPQVQQRVEASHGGRACALRSQRDELGDILHDGPHLGVHVRGTRLRLILAFAFLIGGHRRTEGSLTARPPARGDCLSSRRGVVASRFLKPRRNLDVLRADGNSAALPKARCRAGAPTASRTPPSTEDTTAFIMSRQAHIDDATMRIEVRVHGDPARSRGSQPRGGRRARPDPCDPHARSREGFFRLRGKDSRNAASAPRADRGTLRSRTPAFADLDAPRRSTTLRTAEPLARRRVGVHPVPAAETFRGAAVDAAPHGVGA